MSRYRLRPKAEGDLAEIWQYSVQEWSVAQADAYYRSLIEGFEKLAQAPKLGRPFSQGRRGYLSYAIGSHVARWISGAICERRPANATN